MRDTMQSKYRLRGDGRPLDTLTSKEKGTDLIAMIMIVTPDLGSLMASKRQIITHHSISFPSGIEWVGGQRNAASEYDLRALP